MKNLSVFLVAINVVSQPLAAMAGDVAVVPPQNNHFHKRQLSAGSVVYPNPAKKENVLPKDKAQTPAELTEEAFRIVRPPVSTEADFKKAFELMHQAAEAGYSIAQYHLSTMYADGIGTEKDAEQSAAWCEKAAESNHPNALNEMGVNHQFGIGVKQDTDLAAQFFQRAIAHGADIAKENLEKLQSGRS